MRNMMGVYITMISVHATDRVRDKEEDKLR